MKNASPASPSSKTLLPPKDELADLKEGRDGGGGDTRRVELVGGEGSCGGEPEGTAIHPIGE